MTITVTQPNTKVLTASVGGPAGPQGVPGQSAVQRVAAAPIAAGRACRTTAVGQTMTIATSDLRTRPFDALCLDDIQSGATGNFHVAGPVPANVLQLGAGVACAVGVTSAGVPVRATDPACASAPNWVGTCDVAGNVTFQPRNAKTYDVRDFGAACDGTTDDSAAVQAALLAAGGATGPRLAVVAITAGISGGPYAVAQTATPHGLTTGDTVLVWGVAGSKNLNVQVTVTVVDGTHVTLDSVVGLASDGTTPAAGTGGFLVKTIPIGTGTSTAGAQVDLPAATISLGSATLVIPKAVVVRGQGKYATFILSTSSTDIFASLMRVNGSAICHGGLRDLTIQNNNGANTGAGIWQRGGTFFDVVNVGVNGAKYGVIFDQTESGTIRDPDFESCLTAGVWLTSGGDYSPGALAQYTNAITIDGGSINGSPYGVIDDGGAVHNFVGGTNYNGCGEDGIRITGVVPFQIKGIYSESTKHPVHLSALTEAGNSGGTAYGTIENNELASVTGGYPVLIDSAGLVGIFFNILAAGLAGVGGVVNAVELEAWGNTGTGQAGGLYDSVPARSFMSGDVGYGLGCVPKCGLDVANGFATRPQSLVLSNGANHNVHPASMPQGGYSFGRITGPTGAFSIGGIGPSSGNLGAGVDGQQLILYNTTAQAMTITNEDASSVAANRITTLTGADVVLAARKSIATFVYDGTTARWILKET
jgi:hypothetical protein